MSSIVPCEDSETQLCIAHSVEVRSDEIVADSVLSTDDAVLPGSEVAKDNRNLQSHPVVSKHHVTDIHTQTQAKTRTDLSGNQKSACATASCAAVHSHDKPQSTSHHSDAEADAGNKHCYSVQKTVCRPVVQNDVLKLSSQV